MKYQQLGSLGLEVSQISIGTVELGIPYGFRMPREAVVPNSAESLRLLRAAFDAGVNCVDTAPTYGEAERIIGEALREAGNTEILVAGKIPTFGERPDRVVEESLRRLRREYLDILQIYSVSPDVNAVLRTLEVATRLQDVGKARILGISLYEESIAHLALGIDALKVIQLPFNLLDQRMAARVLPAAKERGVAVIARSPLLKGILTERRRTVPLALAPLVHEADCFALAAKEAGMTLTRAALSFCASQEQISTVLVGIKNPAELTEAIQSVELDETFEHWRGYQFPHKIELLDPRTWPDV